MPDAEYLEANQRLLQNILAGLERNLGLDSGRVLLYKQAQQDSFDIIEGFTAEDEDEATAEEHERDMAEGMPVDPARRAKERNGKLQDDANSSLERFLPLLQYVRPDGHEPEIGSDNKALPLSYQHALWRRTGYYEDDPKVYGTIEALEVYGLGQADTTEGANLYGLHWAHDGVIERFTLLSVDSQVKASALGSIKVATQGIYGDQELTELLAEIRKRAIATKEGELLTEAHNLSVPSQTKLEEVMVFLGSIE